LNAGAIVFVIGLVLSIAGMLGVAYAVFKSATVTKTIELLEAENKALQSSVNRQKDDLESLIDRVKNLEYDNKRLQNLVTGREAIEELSKWAKTEAVVRRDEHNTMLASMHALAISLSEVKDLLQELWRAIPRLLGGTS
jgi:predicted RNase H-like nuclease (RuvC/YqgF family)